MSNGQSASSSSHPLGRLAQSATGVDAADFPLAVGSSGLAAQPATVSAMLPPRLIDRLTSAERKEYPLCEGFVDYFPDAMALVAHLSWAANEKHNPGEPLHHARNKSADEADCIMRHLSCRDGGDDIVFPSGRKVYIPHRVAMAWRAMAELQKWAEMQYGLGLPTRAW